MYFFFPLVGVFLSWIGLNYVGPPKAFGELNPVSILLWLALIGFSVRLFAAFFGVTPDTERNPDEHR